MVEKKEHAKPKPAAVQIDKKGRMIVPLAIRKALGLEPGDTLFVEQEGEEFRVAKPENPFDGLARHAIKEYRAGRTITLEEWAEREGVSLDEEE
jgi:AbrB family looped-hinge helix DNA binding protein